MIFGRDHNLAFLRHDLEYSQDYRAYQCAGMKASSTLLKVISNSREPVTDMSINAVQKLESEMFLHLSFV